MFRSKGSYAGSILYARNFALHNETKGVPPSKRPLVSFQVDFQTFEFSVEMAAFDAQSVSRARHVSTVLFKLLQNVVPIESQAGFRQASSFRGILWRTIFFQHDRWQMPHFQAAARSHDHHPLDQNLQPVPARAEHEME
jgi:hypothetical protein